MSEAKKAEKKIVEQRLIDLGEADSVGPDELELIDGTYNEKTLATWVRDLRIFVSSMEILERVVVVRHDNSGKLYLCSVPAKISASPEPS